MPITTLLDPSLLPARTMDESAFNAAVAYLMTNLPVWGAQVNSTLAGMNIVAAGGAMGVPYTFDTSTTNGDPGSGKLRMSASTAAATTAIYMDVIGSDGLDYTGVLDQFDASSSTVKGYMLLRKASDPTKWAVFAVNGRTTVSGYRAFNVTCITQSTPAPFSVTDPVTVQYTRNGDKGDPGTNSLVLLSSATVSTAVANIDFLSVFSSGYDRYVIDLTGVNAAGAGNLNFNFVTGGSAVDASSNYYLGVDGASPAATTGFSFGVISSAAVSSMSATLEVRNANSSGKPKGFAARGSSNLSLFIKEGIWNLATAAPTGFRLACSGGNFTAGTVRVYGVKNS
jgi:hypothetical protein